jgi:peptidoglycan/xylan/chitin deacetylase (PgdA/CDA1 family)
VRAVCLMYHDVHAGGEPAADIPGGAARYHVSRDVFRRQLELLRPAWERGAVSLTFDDGWRGSLTIGVESLLEAGMAATFFVTRDLVGRGRYADEALLREAHAAGMEIGTHGATHRFLADLSASQIEKELASSKTFLEDLLGAEVPTGSVPGGAWSPIVAETAARCGYRALYTSRPGVNDEHTDPFALRRIPIRRGTSRRAVERFARLSVRREVVRAAVLEAPRMLLGRKRYEALRARLLG